MNRSTERTDGAMCDEDQREVERQRKQTDAQRRERVAETAPAPRVLRTPREQAEAYVENAGQYLLSERGHRPDVVAAATWLDRALAVLRQRDVIDGAAELRNLTEEALDHLRDAEPWVAEGTLREMLVLFDRQVRVVGVPVTAEDFEPVTDERRETRAAVRDVLRRHAVALAACGADVPDATIDELITAAVGL